MPRKPTRKQKAAVKLILENPSLSTSEVMRQVGYSDASVVDPNKNLLETKGFQELFDEVITSEDLLKVHKHGLKAFRETPRIIGRDLKGSPIYDYIQVPDFNAQHKFLETGYKIKGRLTSVNGDNMSSINITLATYEADKEHQHTVSLHAQTVPTPVSKSDGQRIQESGDSVAPT